MSTTLRMLLATALVVASTACSTAATDSLETVRIASLKGPTTMSLAGIMSTTAGDDAQARYSVSVHGSPDEIVPMLARGDVDIALIPANLAAVLANSMEGTGDDIVVVAAATLGVLSIVENGHTISSIADLNGRTVVSTGRGTTPQYVLEYLLRASELEPGQDVNVVYKSEATEVVSALTEDPSLVGVLPQPYVTVVTSTVPQIRIALDLNDPWNEATEGSPWVTAVVVARADFAGAHPDAVRQFLADFQSSTQFVNTSPDLAAPTIVEAGIVPTAELAVAAIPGCHIVFMTGPTLREALEGYLSVLYDADPASVGGRLPGDDFYFAD